MARKVQKSMCIFAHPYPFHFPLPLPLPLSFPILSHLFLAAIYPEGPYASIGHSTWWPSVPKECEHGNRWCSGQGALG